MKKLLLVMAATLCCGLFTACHSISGPGGWSVKSFGQKTTFESMTCSTNGTVTVTGYNNDQVTLPLATLQVLQALAAKAATGGVAP